MFSRTDNFQYQNYQQSIKQCIPIRKFYNLQDFKMLSHMASMPTPTKEALRHLELVDQCMQENKLLLASVLLTKTSAVS